jgi:hypothetical protein
VYLYLILPAEQLYYISTDHISKGTSTIISVQVRQTNKRAEEPDAEPIEFHLFKDVPENSKSSIDYINKI